MEGDTETTFLGHWKSGRTWKSAGEPFKKLVKSTGSRPSSWEGKMAERKKLERERRLIKELKEKKQAEKDKLKQQRQASAARRKANIEASTVTQTISNTKKLKTLKKRQLKNIRKV